MPDPDEPLGLTVHAMPQPAAALSRQRVSGRWKMFAVMAVCAAPVIASYFTFFVVRPSVGTAYGSLIQPPVPLPAVDALTPQGVPQPMRGLAGQWLLIVVDSAACSEVCERHLFMQRQLREMTGREADRIEKIWLVTDDKPIRPELLKALEATPAMTVLRLPRLQVEAWLRPASGQQLEDHLYIVDPLGEWMMRSPAQPDPNRLKRDIDRLLKASAGWDRPGRQALINPDRGGAAASAPRP
jgi:hypothetical protein